jgi:glycosyltransferase involved in cell wall biosynthesis
LNDPEAWARTLDELLADERLREGLAAAGRLTARDEFSLERTVDGTLAVYRAVLGSQ